MFGWLTKKAREEFHSNYLKWTALFAHVAYSHTEWWRME
jgi:hypothetical protein